MSGVLSLRRRALLSRKFASWSSRLLVCLSGMALRESICRVSLLMSMYIAKSP